MQQRAKELRVNRTAAEDRLWSVLRNRHLAGLKFRRQHVLGHYIADFVCIPARLVIEVDGDTHGGDAAAYDAMRTKAMERAGYRVIRFWNSYVRGETRDGVTETILEALRTSALPAAEKERLFAEGLFERPSP
jgi:very-short-patch-repair endonuclease